MARHDTIYGRTARGALDRMFSESVLAVYTPSRGDPVSITVVLGREDKDLGAEVYGDTADRRRTVRLDPSVALPEPEETITIGDEDWIVEAVASRTPTWITLTVVYQARRRPGKAEGRT